MSLTVSRRRRAERLHPGPAAGGGAHVVAHDRRERLLFRLLRTVNRLMPKDNGTVVLHSLPYLEDGVRSVLEVLVPGRWRVIVLVDGALPATGPPGVRLVRKRSLAGAWYFLRAGRVFTTHGLFGELEPPRGQLVVNLWHGEPPVKKVGRYEGQQERRASVMPVLSTVGQAYRCTEFGLHPRRVPVLGAPRNDQMLRSDRSSAREALLGPDAHRITFLWMPTFRAMRSGRHERRDTRGRSPALPFSRGELARLDDWLTERDLRIVVKLHPLDAVDVAGGFRAVRVLHDDDLTAAGLSVYRSLPAFDGLITDASSVWIDYLLLDRPIVVAFPDIDDYRATRGLNLEPYEAWVPGPFVTTVSELTDVLEQLASRNDTWALIRRRATRQLHQHHDAGSTRRLLTHVGILP